MPQASSKASPGRPTSRWVRFCLGGVLSFVALNALGGGYYGLAGAQGVPREWLAGSPFPDYFVPSLVLLAVVGGSCLIAASAVFARHRTGRLTALTAGTIVLGWIGVQLTIIGWRSWLQPATTAAGLTVLVLAWLLPDDTSGRPRRRASAHPPSPPRC
jgi:hypothetical protein